MSARIRGTLLIGALLAALATAGPGWAAFAPQISVRSTAGAVRVAATVGQTDDPTARVQIYIPSAFHVTTGAQVGTKLGSVTGTASAADLNGAVLQLQGSLVVIAPDAAAQAQCGIQAAAATWDMHLQAATQTLDIPLYVVATSGAEASAGAAKLVVCLPPPDVPTGTPGRSVFGAKLLSAVFTSSAIAAPTAVGEFRWTSLWTPYTPGKGTPNLTGSVEAQSLVRTPSQVEIVRVVRSRLARTATRSVHGRKVKHLAVSTAVSFTARVTQGGTPVAGARVTARAGGKSVAAKTTAAAGLAAGAFVFTKGTVTLAVTATVPDRDLGAAGCVATAAFGGAACVDATAGGGTVAASTRITAYRR